MNTKIQSISFSALWDHIHSRPLVWDTITTTFFSTAGKSVGFLIPFFIAAWFGVTSETDAFFVAYGLILFLSGIFAPVVESVIVPYIAEARAKGEDVGKLVGGILGGSAAGLLILTTLILLVAKPVLSLLTRFDVQELHLVYTLLLETAPLILLLVWTSVLAGALNAYKKFVFPAISPGFRAIVTVIIIFVFKDIIGVHAIAWGYVAGEIVRLAILIGAIRRLTLFPLGLSLKVGAKLQEFFKTASYQIIGMSAVGLNPLVDKIMASWLGVGSVSVLHYADRLYMIPITFMTTGLMVTLLSHWSKTYYALDRKRLKDDVQRTVKIVGLITIPIMLFLIAIHQQIVQMAFGRGVFDQAILPEVGWVWACYLFGFLPYMLGRVYVVAHLVLKNTRVLMTCAFYVTSLNILLNFLLMRPLGVAGIALATTLASLFSLFYLGGAFHKNSGKEKLKI